jgi:outer membrane protein insertion porin family
MKHSALALLLFASVAQAAEGDRLAWVDIEGRLLEPKEKLLSFLGLCTGAPYDESDQRRLTDDLQSLGYRILEQRLYPGPSGLGLRLKLEPVRVVRQITISGNWPLFDDDVLRNLRLHSGSELVADDELREFLDEEEARIVAYLAREGYFGGEAHIIPRKGPVEHWIDLDIRINKGEWLRLGTVLPEGNRAIHTDELFSIFDHCCWFWGRFGVGRMREDARDAEKLLYERGYPGARVRPEFKLERDVDPKTRRVLLPVRVSEKRRVEVKFVGNRALSDRDLKEQLTIFTAGAYDDIELGESAKAIHRYYQQQGYFEAQVTFSRQRLSADLEQVVFTVDEGPELKVRRVEVLSESGAPLPFAEEEIRSGAALETKLFPRLGVIGLGQGGYATTLQLHQDEERIAEFFRAAGYPQVKVRSELGRDPDTATALGALGAEVAGNLGKDDLYVRFYVEPGRQEQVAHVEVRFAGEHGKRAHDVLAALRMTDGRPFTEAAFLQDQNRIVTLYKTSGHPYVLVKYKDQWDAAHARLNLTYEIDEGPLVRFGEILIRGNFKTRDRVILADLPFRTGDVFDRTKLDQGERNLQTHLIFNSASIKVALEGQRNPVPVLVTVRERFLERFGTATVGFGASTDLKNVAYVAVGWQWNNVFGLGSQLELRFNHGFSDTTFFDTGQFGVNLRYTDLRAFGPGWRFDLNLFFRREFTFRLGTVQTLGFSQALTRYLTPSVRLYLRYENYLSGVTVPVFRLTGPNDTSSVGDDTHTTKLSIGLVWDRRIGADGLPNLLLPVKGWLLSGAVGWAFPAPTGNTAADLFLGAGGDHNFLVISGQALGLYPIKLRGLELQLLAHLRYDEGIPFGEPALPVVERFSAGGSTATRGYDTDQLKTEIVRQNVAPLPGAQGFRVVPQGGDIRILSTLELQFPIARTFIGLPWPWVGAVFYDVGAIADAPNLIRVSDFKHAIGLALLRVLTPFGPLSVEYAYPLTQTLAEERWKTNPWYSHFPGRIHFNWGIPVRL